MDPSPGRRGTAGPSVVSLVACVGILLAASPAFAACSLVSHPSSFYNYYHCPVASDLEFREAVAVANAGLPLVRAVLSRTIVLESPVSLTGTLAVWAQGHGLTGHLTGGGTLGVVDALLTVTAASTVSYVLGDYGQVRLSGNTASLEMYGETAQLRALASLEINRLYAGGGCLICPGARLRYFEIDTGEHTLAVRHFGLGVNAVTSKVGSGTLAIRGDIDTNTVAVREGVLEIDGRWRAVVLAGGTLRAGASTRIGDGAFSFPNGTGVQGSVLLLRPDSTIDTNRFKLVAAGLEGPGGLTKRGLGTLVLLGKSRYQGATNVLDGTLRVANLSALPSTTVLTIAAPAVVDTSGDIAVAGLNGAGRLGIADGAFTVAGADRSRFSGVIDGNGRLVKTGSGSLTLLGANGYHGGTTVAGGLLIGNASSLQGRIHDEATLTFDQRDTGTFGGAISGTGIVTKVGSGRLAFAQPQAYSGLTRVSEGELHVRGLSGSVSVDAGATFGGSGPVGGDLNLAPGSSLLVNVGATPSMLDVGGQADVAGASVVLTGSAQEGPRIQTVPFLHAAGGLAGSFAGVRAGAFVDGTVRAQGQSAYLVLERTDIPLSPLATERNAVAAGKVVDLVRSPASGGLAAASADLRLVLCEVGGLPDAEVSGALSQLSGSHSADAISRSVLESQDILRSVNDRIVDLRSTRSSEGGSLTRGGAPAWARGLWLRAIGQLGVTESSLPVGGLLGGLVGLDRPVNTRWTLGAFGGYERVTRTLEHAASRDARARVGGYVALDAGSTFVTGSISGAAHRFETSRHITFAVLAGQELGGGLLFGGIDRTASARFAGKELSGTVEAGRAWSRGAWLLQPMVGMDASRLSTRAFNEAGAGSVDLLVAEGHVDSFRSAVGLRATRAAHGARRLTPRLELRYLRQLGDRTVSLPVAWADASHLPFTARSTASRADGLSAAAGILVTRPWGALLSIDYRGTVGLIGYRQLLAVGLGF